MNSIDKKGLNNFIYKHRYSLVLYLFVIMDFLYTYIGVCCLGVIEEGNPLLVWLFTLDFHIALLIRVIMGLFLISAIIYIREKEHKSYNFVVGLGLVVNIGVTFMHWNWMYLSKSVWL